MTSVTRLVLACVLLAPACEAASCDQLRSTARHVAITSATPMSAGDLPAWCRVLILVRPVADSEIRMELWLPPAEGWNGKFLGTGNGGYSSTLSYPQMRDALRRGYATAGSDTGHSGGDLAFGAGNPEKINDWAWRAVHVMTETAHAVIRSYYGRSSSHSYFEGCSTGGPGADGGPAVPRRLRRHRCGRARHQSRPPECGISLELAGAA